VDKFGSGERVGQLYEGTENGQRCEEETRKVRRYRQLARHGMQRCCALAQNRWTGSSCTVGYQEQMLNRLWLGARAVIWSELDLDVRGGK